LSSFTINLSIAGFAFKLSATSPTALRKRPFHGQDVETAQKSVITSLPNPWVSQKMMRMNTSSTRFDVNRLVTGTNLCWKRSPEKNLIYFNLSTPLQGKLVAVRIMSAQINSFVHNIKARFSHYF